jgi:ketosteroid isomerase-like protein
MHEHIIESIRRGYDAFNQGVFLEALEVFAPDILWVEPDEFPAGGTYRGHEGVVEYLTRARANWAQVESYPEDILEAGNKLVVLVRFQGWPIGGDQSVESLIGDVYTIQDDKVVRMQAYSDPEEARRAVGLASG